MSTSNLTLWYSKPAQEWIQALPIGNGRLGAMAYGGVRSERLQLNEETVWARPAGNGINPKALDLLSIEKLQRRLANNYDGQGWSLG